MQEITLKTPTDEIIAYDNVQVEITETVVVPEKTETVSKTYTVREIEAQLADIEVQMQQLTVKKAELLELEGKIKAEANKVVTAIKYGD